MSMNGIDISLWQKGLDLSRIKCDFVIIKATEGLTIVDPQFRNFVTQAKALNKPMGFYHFARPDKNSAKDEAQFYVKTITPWLRQGIMCLDWECGDLSNTDWVLTWLDEVKRLTGVKPLLYTSQYYANCYDWSKVAAGDYGLWCAKWRDKNLDYNYDMSNAGTKPTSKYWPIIAIWQWTSCGRIDGYNNNLDCDIFYGDRRAWNLYAGYQEPKSYTVKEGDTLTGIAEATGSSVDEIVAKNGLIHAGQMLLI